MRRWWRADERARRSGRCGGLRRRATLGAALSDGLVLRGRRVIKLGVVLAERRGLEGELGRASRHAEAGGRWRRWHGLSDRSEDGVRGRTPSVAASQLRSTARLDARGELGARAGRRREPVHDLAPELGRERRAAWRPRKLGHHLNEERKQLFAAGRTLLRVDRLAGGRRLHHRRQARTVREQHPAVQVELVGKGEEEAARRAVQAPLVVGIARHGALLSRRRMIRDGVRGGLGAVGLEAISAVGLDEQREGRLCITRARAEVVLVRKGGGEEEGRCRGDAWRWRLAPAWRGDRDLEA